MRLQSDPARPPEPLRKASQVIAIEIIRQREGLPVNSWYSPPAASSRTTSVGRSGRNTWDQNRRTVGDGLDADGVVFCGDGDPVNRPLPPGDHGHRSTAQGRPS